jgi:hypothetical protein
MQNGKNIIKEVNQKTNEENQNPNEDNEQARFRKTHQTIPPEKSIREEMSELLKETGCYCPRRKIEEEIDEEIKRRNPTTGHVATAAASALPAKVPHYVSITGKSPLSFQPKQWPRCALLIWSEELIFHSSFANCQNKNHDHFTKTYQPCNMFIAFVEPNDNFSEIFQTPCFPGHRAEENRYTILTLEGFIALDTYFRNNFQHCSSHHDKSLCRKIHLDYMHENIRFTESIAAFTESFCVYHDTNVSLEGWPGCGKSTAIQKIIDTSPFRTVCSVEPADAWKHCLAKMERWGSRPGLQEYREDANEFFLASLYATQFSCALVNKEALKKGMPFICERNLLVSSAQFSESAKIEAVTLKRQMDLIKRLEKWNKKGFSTIVLCDTMNANKIKRETRMRSGDTMFTNDNLSRQMIKILHLCAAQEGKYFDRSCFVFPFFDGHEHNIFCPIMFQRKLFEFQRIPYIWNKTQMYFTRVPDNPLHFELEEHVDSNFKDAYKWDKTQMYFMRVPRVPDDPLHLPLEPEDIADAVAVDCDGGDDAINDI